MYTNARCNSITGWKRGTTKKNTYNLKKMRERKKENLQKKAYFAIVTKDVFVERKLVINPGLFEEQELIRIKKNTIVRFQASTMVSAFDIYMKYFGTNFSRISEYRPDKRIYKDEIRLKL